MQNVGRNDPCPCGSGKKYKKCCMLKQSGEEKKLKNLDLSNFRPTQFVEDFEEVPNEKAITFYTREFIERGYGIMSEELKEFFRQCILKDGYVDSQRVEEFCEFLKKKERVAVSKKDIAEFFKDVKNPVFWNY